VPEFDTPGPERHGTEWKCSGLLPKSIWYDSDCAVAILSADDQLVDGTFNARPNVLYEIGFAMGFFDFRYWEDERVYPVLLVKDETTPIPTDFLGPEYFSYDQANGIDVTATFERLDNALEALFKRIRDYFR
jgi:hypothetical protein